MKEHLMPSGGTAAAMPCAGDGPDPHARARAIVSLIEQDAEERRLQRIAARTALALRRRTYDPERDNWRDEIRRVIALAEGVEPDRVDRDARLRQRHTFVCSLYDDLRAAGRMSKNIYNLNRAHADVLHRVWRAKYAPATLAKRWGQLRAWTDMLEKGPMIPPLDAYSATGEVSAANHRPAPPLAVSTLAVSTRVEVPADSQYLEAFTRGLRALDLTAYFILRARTCLAIGLTDAIQLQPVAASAVLEGFLVLSKGKGRQGRQIELDSADRRALVEELAAFVRGQRRSTLGWAGLTLEQARDRYKRKVRTVRERLARRGHGAPEGAFDHE